MINYPVRDVSEGLQQSRQELKFIIRKEHFRNGRLEIKCAAVLGTHYSQSRQQMYSGGYHKNDIITLQSQYFSGLYILFY